MTTLYLLGLLFLQQPAPDTLRVGLVSLVEQAVERSPEVGQMQAKVDFAEARYRFARANRFLTEFDLETGHAVAPGLERNGTAQPETSLYLDPEVRNDWSLGALRPYNQAEISIGQPLLTWGELGRSIDAAESGIGVAAAEQSNKAIEVALRAGESYYGLLLAEALFRIAEETEQVLVQAQEEIDRLLQEGTEDVDDADLFEVRILEQEFRRQLVEVTQQRALARTAVLRQLRLPDGIPVEPTDTELEPLMLTLDSLDTYIALGLAQRPEVAQAAAGLAAREALVDVARSAYYPKLFLGATAQIRFAQGRPRQPNPYISEDFNGQSVRAGVGFRYDLNFAQTKSRVRQAEAEREEVRFQQDAADLLIRFEVEEAYRTVVIRRAALDAQTEALQISKEWLRTEQINFDLELGDTENLVRAVQSNLELQARYYNAVQRYNVAVLRLLARTGILSAGTLGGMVVDQ